MTRKQLAAFYMFLLCIGLTPVAIMLTIQGLENAWVGIVLFTVCAVFFGIAAFDPGINAELERLQKRRP